MAQKFCAKDINVTPDPTYSVIIPVLKLAGNPHLPGILDSLAKQTRPPQAVHLVAGDKRQGRAINYGVRQAETPYIGTVDDDTQIDDPALFDKLIKAMDADPTIGMAGAACLIPGDATPFQKRAMRQIYRRTFPVQDRHVDSDMVQHPCLLMTRALFTSIGGEDEELVRGLDPVLRQKVRDAGKRVTIIADTWIYHLLPDGFWPVMRMYYRNGRGSGFASRFYPHKILELTHGYDQGDFPKKRSLIYRTFRRLGTLLKACVTGQYIRAGTDIAYMAGTIKERLHPDYVLAPPPIKDIQTEQEAPGRHPYALFTHHVILVEQGKP